jgi:ABC-type amino acid transport substrate-binding protein
MRSRFLLLLSLFVVALISMVMVFNSSVTAGERTIRFIGDCDFPPFAFKDDSGYTGFDIELGEAIGRVMGAKVEWVSASFDLKAYAAALDDKTADAILSALTITDSRKKDFDFTTSYFRTTLGIAAINKLKVSALLQLRKRKFEGSKVGVMKGTTGEVWARKNLKADLILYGSAVDMARNLWEKTLKAILIDEELLNYIVSCFPYDFAIISRDLNHEVYGIAVKKGNEKLLQDLNAALKKVDDSGTYKEIYNRWFKPTICLPDPETVDTVR